MCGILGSINLQGGLHNEIFFKNCLNLLEHRGPDSQGFSRVNLLDKSIFFGHRRLSIIDLSSDGQQPMISNDGKYHLIFNGEIYNYKEIRKELESDGSYFKTKTDTEVLLQSWIKWGPSSLDKLIGMFSFAILNLQKNEMFIANDPYGIKPLFYYQGQEEFIFCSEPGPLLKLANQKISMNYEVAHKFLTLGIYDEGSNSFFRNVSRLEPGHLLQISLKEKININKKKWWRPSLEINKSITFEEASRHLEFLLEDSIKLHLRSDVPVGAALSGGIDSSAVICLMNKVNPNMQIETFTYIPEIKKYSEKDWAQMVINYLPNCKPNFITFTNQDLIEDLSSLIKAQGEPFGGLSIYAQFKIFEAAKERGIKVMLEGQGADEVFAGYNGYPLFMLKSFLERNELQKAISFFINAGKLPDKSHLHLLQSFVALLTPQTFLNLGRKIIGKENLTPSWINSKQLIEREDMNGYSFFDFSNEDLIGRRLIERLYLAQTYSGLPALLRHSDRNSMAHSIESRVPFLNKNISEYVFSLKESFLHSNEGITKNILRNSLQGIIPSQILNRKDKIGFATSELQILQQNPSQLFNAIEILDRFRLFNKERLYKFMKTSLKKINNMDKTPWRILNLALWVEAYNISDD